MIGRLGKDPENRTTRNGTAYTVFPVAVERKWKSREGELRKETDWFSVEAWGKLGEICQSYLSKGRLVFLEGRLRTDRYDHNGETRYFTKIIVSQMQMLDRQPKDSGEAEAEELAADVLFGEDELD
ncbi:single-stranded DNA-binding protein [Pelolinea submarina]|uniref:single-stranded DNA-binding protein n=1 Tax=Pelolinea submarina TaxID=913107 RepID=UPI000E21FB54|nr:single-stranded DNA-binding protein [Pelolinea submarina]